MPSQEFESIVQLLKSVPRETGISFEARRSDFEKRTTVLPIAEGVLSQPIQIEGLGAEWIIPPQATDTDAILFFHGGGFCMGSTNTHRSMASFLARAAQTRVLLIDYRLAPENPFPAAVEDATASYEWLLSEGVMPERIVLAGDSAGGGIAISTLVALKDRQAPMPAAAVCMSPWVDLEGTGESRKTKQDLDFLVRPSELEELSTAYLGGVDPRTPLASPINADLSGLPPLLIQVGTSEVLLDDSKRLAENAKKAGVHVTLDIWEDMIHVFQFFAFMVPEAGKAIEAAAVFIGRHKGRVE